MIALNMHILISNKRVWVDQEDWKLYGNYPWHIETNHGYVVYRKNIDGTKKKIYLHRLIMNSPDSRVVDHINGNKLDNRRKNLRLCSHHQNLLNRKKINGIAKTSDGKKWRAYVNIYNRDIHKSQQISLGNYNTKKEAKIATVACRKLLDSVYTIYDL